MTEKHKIRPATVVVSHLNADFDAFASAVAAAKLYPGSVVILPGSQEKGLRDFLFSGETGELPVARLRETDLSEVERIVVVDTRQRDRIGIFADLLERAGVEVVIYDHHPPSGGDIRGDTEVVKPYGSNTTLLVELLAEKGISISPGEATLFSIGIYEDTGSFTFPSTTPNDLKAAALLIEAGADIKKVAQVVRHRFTPAHLELLQELRRSAVVYSLGAARVTVAKSSTMDYLEDVSIIAGEMMDMDGLTSLFALVLMEGQVVVVGRSRDERVDVAKVLEKIGGGGHPSAASATLRGMTLAEAEERLVAAMQAVLGREPKVADIMTTPVLSVEPSTPLFEVHDQLTRLGITVLPVVEEGRPVGLISRRTVEKALYHGLGRLPVKEYMTTDFSTVTPDHGLFRVQEIIIGNRQRFLPVVDKGGAIVGVITRTDLLQLLAGDRSLQPEPLLEQREQSRDVSRLLRSQVDERIVKLLEKAGEAAEALGVNAYVVGGFVRDMLLRVENTDLDIVAEGDGIALARRLASDLNARVREHRKFGTAVVILPDGFKLDVATARWEYYEYPAAMPTVTLSSIKLDLFRRDFTINTLAVQLNPGRFGLLIDFFGGQRDLKDKVIRVLHSLSFVEDPTRVFRAIRFEQRYGFRIGKHTLRLIENAKELDLFSKLSGKRLCNEIRLILSENDPRPALARIKELGLLEAICSGIGLSGRTEELLGGIYDSLAWHRLTFPQEEVEGWTVYLAGLLMELKMKDANRCAQRLSLPKKARRVLFQAMKEGRALAERLDAGSPLRSSIINRLLSPLEPEVLLLLLSLARSSRARADVVKFLTELRGKEKIVTGSDLKEMGLPPGPAYAEILSRVHDAYLDGEVKDRQEALALCRKLARSGITPRRPSLSD